MGGRKGGPCFLRWKSIPYGPRDVVKRKLNNVVEKGLLNPVESSRWDTSIVM